MNQEQEHEAATVQKSRGPRLADPRDALPPLNDFLSSLATLPADERPPLLWDDQRERWLAGERPPVEQYVKNLPAPVPADLILDLIYGEFVLRQEVGETPTIAEYQRRFPEFAAQISRQLSLHAAFSQGASTMDERDLPESVTLADVPGYPAEIAGYKIVAVLDSGGQGLIYRAVHPTLNRDVVIKLGHKPATARRETDALIREGRILAELDDPGLARVYDMRIHDGRPCLVMEFLRGRNLAQEVRDRPMPPLAAAALVARIARSLAVAHRRGVIHRDIKPRNILIGEDGNPRLIDFGLAWFEDAWSAPPDQAGLSGTVSYMPPEQARGEAPTVQSDVFALGAVLYFLLTGEAPFVGGSFNEVHDKAQRGDWDRALLASTPMPAKLRTIVEQALTTEPAARPRSAEALAAALEKLNRPHRRVWIMAACAAALLIGVGGFVAWQATRPTPVVAPVVAVTIPPSLEISVGEEEAVPQDLTKKILVNVGNVIRFDAMAPKGMHASLFAMGSSGKLTELASLHAADSDRPLRFPADTEKAVPLTGVGGNELVLFCARRSGPVAMDEVRDVLSDWSKWRDLPSGWVLTLKPELKTFTNTRDLGLDVPVKIDNPVKDLETRLTNLAAELRARNIDHFEVILFSHDE